MVVEEDVLDGAGVEGGHHLRPQSARLHLRLLGDPAEHQQRVQVVPVAEHDVRVASGRKKIEVGSYIN